MSSDFTHPDLSLPLDASGPACGGSVASESSRSLQSQVQDLQAQLLDAQRLEGLGLLAAGIAHDFNNLITAVLGYTELARADMVAESRAASHCEHAAKGLRRAAELARQLMAYAGRSRLQVHPVSLSGTITDLEGLLDAWVGGHGSLIRDLDPNLPEITADPVQMAQLVMNLVGNSAEAISGGRGTVTLRTHAETCDAATFHGCQPTDQLPPGRYVRLQVSDTGSGISSEAKVRMFDPCFSTKGKQRGERGLGLSIVQAIVVRHHGTIRVESEPERGTTMTVYLPTFGAPDPIVTGPSGLATSPAQTAP